MSSRSRQRFLDSIYVGLLALYVLAGMWLTPFHGDESTIIYMSRDVYLLTNDFQSVLYKPVPAAGKEQEEQELRFLNGTVSKDLIGLGWALAGMRVEDLPGPWAWGLDWWENRYYDHLPGIPILFVSRLSAALTTALSVAVVFTLTRRIAGRGPAWIASFVYATMPAVLLNGRRAVFEGAQLLGTALVIWAGIEVARYMQRCDIDSRALLKRWLLLGAASAFALASKHTTIVTIAPVFGMLVILNWRKLWQTISCAFGAVFVAGVLFLLLNPGWWSAPLQVPGYVLQLRSNMMATQNSFYDELADVGKRVTTPMGFLLGKPQYAEDAKFDWTPWIGDQITAYQASGLAGIDWSRLGILGYIIPAIGLLALLIERSPARIVFASTAFVSSAIIVLTNTLPWQRYYLPLSACLAVLIGVGVQVAANYFRRYVRRAPVGSRNLPKLAS
jgi:4-amino-4-deoxy-L-arabinose transferase-like glycosyltransferase